MQAERNGFSRSLAAELVQSGAVGGCRPSNRRLGQLPVDVSGVQKCHFRGHLSAVMNAEFPVGTAEVRLDGLRAKEQMVRRLSRRRAIGDGENDSELLWS